MDEHARRMEDDLSTPPEGSGALIGEYTVRVYRNDGREEVTVDCFGSYAKDAITEDIRRELVKGLMELTAICYGRDPEGGKVLLEQEWVRVKQ